MTAKRFLTEDDKTELQDAIAGAQQIAENASETVHDVSVVAQEAADNANEAAEAVEVVKDRVDNIKWSFYSDLSQIGITVGAETIMDIVVAMPVQSELRYEIKASKNNRDAYPYPSGSICFKKYSDGACDIEHVCSANNAYRGTWRMYAVGSSNTFILSDWVQVYDSVNPPTAELIGAFASGTATVTDANDLTDGAWACDYPMSNLPMSAPCIVYQKSYAEGYTVQECTILLFGTTYKRVKYGSWSEWKKVYDENNPPPVTSDIPIKLSINENNGLRITY